MRAFAGELASAAVVCGIAAAIVLELPSAAFSFQARQDVNARADGAFAAYVFMDGQAEAMFLRKAKGTWKKGGREYVDMFVAELPEEQKQPVLTSASRTPPPPLPIVRGGRSPFLPSCRAPAPVRITASADKEELPFSREELLKIE